MIELQVKLSDRFSDRASNDNPPDMKRGEDFFNFVKENSGIRLTELQASEDKTGIDAVLDLGLGKPDERAIRVDALCIRDMILFMGDNNHNEQRQHSEMKKELARLANPVVTLIQNYSPNVKVKF